MNTRKQESLWLALTGLKQILGHFPCDIMSNSCDTSLRKLIVEIYMYGELGVGGSHNAYTMSQMYKNFKNISIIELRFLRRFSLLGSSSAYQLTVSSGLKKKKSLLLGKS